MTRERAPFRIKICGITNVADAVHCERSGADAVGINLYPRSLRSLNPSSAAELARQIPSNLVKVCVFVNESAERIVQTCEQIGTEFVQLHGDETPEIADRMPALKIIRVLSVGSNVGSVLDQAEQWRQMDQVVAFLIDSASLGYGGSGIAVDPVKAREIASALEKPLILAGGLTPENVAEAISDVAPAGVDVASGVESFPGKKDADRVTQFVANAAKAFDRLHDSP